MMRAPRTNQRAMRRVIDGSERGLERSAPPTTPHKLQAEARLGKPSRTEWQSRSRGKKTLEACQFHAVIRASARARWEDTAVRESYRHAPQAQ